MSRLTLRLAVFSALVATLLVVSPAWAGHGHWGGYRSCYRPYASFSFGYGYGCRPFRSYCAPYVSYRSYSCYRPYVYRYCPPVAYCPPVNYCAPIYYGSNCYYGASTYYTPATFLPISTPAEVNYGPQAVQRFIGGGDAPAATPARTLVETPLVRTASTTTASNADTLERAGRWVSIGDNHFGDQKYYEASQRYLTATATAPDDGQAHFRRGHALVALGKYEAASLAFRRGLDVDRSWSDADFRLDEIYGADRVAKEAHLEVLASSALANPRDADLMLVLGIFLHYDGQPERAEKFFRRAAELDSAMAPYTAKFLNGGTSRVASLLRLGS